MSEEQDWPEDVFFCESCGQSFTDEGTKMEHIIDAHELPPVAAGYPENLET